jgi:hypothetical protein
VRRAGLATMLMQAHATSGVSVQVISGEMAFYPESFELDGFLDYFRAKVGQYHRRHASAHSSRIRMHQLQRTTRCLQTRARQRGALWK